MNRNIASVLIIFSIISVSNFSECFGQGKISRPKVETKITYRRMDQLTNEVAYRAEGSNGKYGVIDRNGNIILPCKFYWVEPFRENRSHVILKKNGKSAIINEKGEFITDYIYDGVFSAYEGRIKVSKYDSNGNYVSGVIDLDGNIIIPIIYSTPNDAKWIYVDGKIKLSLNGKELWFDRNGNIISQ